MPSTKAASPTLSVSPTRLSAVIWPTFVATCSPAPWNPSWVNSLVAPIPAFPALLPVVAPVFPPSIARSTTESFAVEPRVTALAKRPAANPVSDAFSARIFLICSGLY